MYYSLCTNIDLNSITVNKPGFETGSHTPKVDMLPLCYTPLTLWSISLRRKIKTAKDRFKKLLVKYNKM